MSFESAFAVLQQPQVAAPVCAVVVMCVALVMRKFRTAGVLGIVLGALLIHWFAFPVPEGVALWFYLFLLALFFGVAIWDQAWVAIYVALMPVINWAFAAVPNFPIPETLGGGLFQPTAIVTGLVLVVRDFSQRQVKHWIWGAMLLGLALSTLTSWIVVVFASGVAFLISETADWAVYTFSKKPLSQRIMTSSLISAPLDQVIFIWLASFVVPGIFAWGTVLTGIASKLLGAWIVSRIVAAQEARQGKIEMKAA